MANVCTPIQVTGTSACPYQVQIARRLVLVPKYGSDGELNNFASVDEVTKANIQAKLDETNDLDRWYALPLMENVENVRAETTFFEWNSGQKARIKQGSRTLTAAMPDGDPKFLLRMQSWVGQEFGMYIIDKWGNFVYSDTDGAVNPIPVDGNSFDVNEVQSTDTDPYYIMLQFDYLQDYNDGYTWMIKKSELDFDGRTTDLYGLQALSLSIVDGAAGVSTVVDVTTDYNVPVAGLLTAAFSLYDVTADTDLNVTDAVESSTIPGRYTLTATTTVQSNTTRLTVTETMYQTGEVEFVVS